MIRLNNWDNSLAATIGGLIGATYTLVMCAISSAISFPSMGIVLFAVVIGTIFGAGILGGISMLLNYARSYGPQEEHLI